MNVARAVLDRLIQNQIDKANDRRRVRFGFHRGGAVVAAHLQEIARFAELLEHFVHARGVGAVRFFDALVDLIGRRDNHFDVFAEREAQILRRARIERISERDAQSVSA